MDEFTRFAAERAAVMNLPHITALKAEHELRISEAVDRMSVQILKEAFQLGYEAGAKSKEAGE